MFMILTGPFFPRIVRSVLYLVHEQTSEAVVHFFPEGDQKPDSEKEGENAGVPDAAYVFQLSDPDRRL